MTACVSCWGTGRAVAHRVERDGRRTAWAVRCLCPAGGAWKGKLTDLAPLLPPRATEPPPMLALGPAIEDPEF